MRAHTLHRRGGEGGMNNLTLPGPWPLKQLAIPTILQAVSEKTGVSGNPISENGEHRKLGFRELCF